MFERRKVIAVLRKKMHIQTLDLVRRGVDLLHLLRVDLLCLDPFITADIDLPSQHPLHVIAWTCPISAPSHSLHMPRVHKSVGTVGLVLGGGLGLGLGLAPKMRLNLGCVAWVLLRACFGAGMEGDGMGLSYISSQLSVTSSGLASGLNFSVTGRS
jgi:hypothetical protein